MTKNQIDRIARIFAKISIIGQLKMKIIKDITKCIFSNWSNYKDIQI